MDGGSKLDCGCEAGCGAAAGSVAGGWETDCVNGGSPVGGMEVFGFAGCATAARWFSHSNPIEVMAIFQYITFVNANS